MTVIELLSRLRDLGITITADGDRLRVNAARGTLTPELRDALTSHKGQLLELLRTKVTDNGEAPITRVPRDQPNPLSFAQERLWFLDQLTPGGTAYSIPFFLRLEGPLDVDALHRALQEIVVRHEALRTAFPAVHGEPRQVILDDFELPLPIERLDGTREEREATAHRLATEEILRPFDLARGPLVRARLLHVDDQDHVLLLALHHAAIDIWSIGLLRNELSTLYEAFREDRASPLEPLPVQYVDFAAWQRGHLVDAVIAGHLAWWESRLAGAETLALPTDHPRPAVQSFAGGQHRSTVPGPVLDGLRRLAREEKASVFMVTLAAFQLLLHHYCGQDDIVIGTTVVNRDREEIKSLIGFFSNTLVMRGNFGGNRTFRSLLRETRETALGAYAHQALPFETLVNKLQPVRDLSRNPIFQVFFAQLNTEPIASDAPRGTGGMRLADLTVTSFAHGKTPTHFDLELDVDESATGLVTRYVYSRDLFDAATIERMDRHYQNLLAAIVAAPDQPAGMLPIMDGAERTEVLDTWNATDAPFAADRCVHELFEAQVRRTPQRTAVVFEGESLTYDELNAAANRIAHSLRRHGVGPEVPVAICMERSIEMVVALLGVLKAGGAYVPLDPGHPPARLGFMIEDTGAAVVLTRSHLAELLGDAVPLVCLDDAASDLAGESAERLPREGDPDALAYVLYTSGSTGRPKGVGVTHRGLVNYLSWCADAYGLASGEVAIVHSPITFDLTVTGLLAPLTVGGRVRLVPEAHGVEGLAQAIRAEDAVGLVKITPAHLQLLGGQLDATERRRVRTFVIGGESLTAEHVSAWMDGATRLINEYGPTETVVGACVHDVVADDLARSSIPIGRPLANARIYVLDRRMAPVPVGIPGEIYIGGAGVARGYVNRPALTAERFVPDPFAAEPGARLYRTGDLARHLPDGGLEFLGRRDEQVKVRGYRIELGEIEGVLLEHDAVTQAVAMVREDRPGDRTLVAYVVGADAPSAGAMRSFLKDRLPEYMVPASFVALDAMPLTPNGKVDRRALPAPGGERQVADAYLAPRGERQEQIAAIWCDVLALEKVGVRDNFFELGGHSLLVVRVHARLVEELECDLTVTDLFQYPTIEKLSRRLRGEGGSETLARQAVRRFPRRHTTETESVAVIAMVGRFPGANSIDELWKNLRNGVEGIHRFSDDELREIGVPEHLIAHPDYVKARGVIDDIDRFDAWFFGYNPREAELIDPQHRIFLECAWEALETAGYDPERYHGAIGVYAGTKANTYEYIVRTRPDLMAAGGNLPQLTGDSDFLATRVAYKLNLRGPSMNVQTACSTSLVAIHEACRGLLDYQCDMALAGGVSLTMPIVGGYIYEEGGIRSPDGHCRVFDARAKGTVAADGAAIVVLKRLDDAIADGDQIHAVVRGTAANNDGSLKVGFTAPSVDGQAEVISLAHARAGVEPDAIGYVEAHGTGTVLGDPIEVAALKQAFRRATARQGFCALGAIKSNLGHLNHAAGVAGFIKAALSVEHGEIPPSLHFERPNPELGIEQSPFFVNTELRAWTGDGKRPRLSAVSSFGIGGTNAHVILEEAPPLEPAGAARPSQLLVLSARNASGLEAAAQNLAAHLRSNEDQTLADVAYTLQVGRRQFEHRRAVLGRNAAEVVEALDGNAPDRTWTQHAEAREHPVAFLFPGQGAQYVDMARDLYRDEAVFRATVDACVAGLAGELDFDLRELLYPAADTVADDASERLTRTSVAQPALFVVEYALAQLWRSWGIEPVAMIGHSSGEYVAACLSGVLELDDALRLVAARGRLMEQMPPGTMLSVPLGEDELRERLAGRDGLWLAAVNAPSLCVVSGHADRIEAFSHKLADSGIDTRRLHTSHAFHSGLMQEAVEPFVEIAGEIEFGTPRIPYLSNVTGDWITEADVSDPSYWGRHIRDAVRFTDGIGRILTETDHVLLEVGPGQVLGSIARQHPDCGRDRLIVPSLRHPQSDVDDASFLMGALGRLWTGGIEVDWSRFHGPGRRRVPLPTYPFQRERYWIEAGRPQQAATRPSLRDWFYVPGWRHTPPVVADPESAPAAFPVLVFADASPLSKQVVADLRRAGGAVTVVEAGDAFAQMDDRFVISAEQTEDYGRLVTELVSADGRPPRVIHLWNATAEEGWLDDAEAARRAELGFYSVLYLARALGEAGGAEPVHMDVVTTGVHEVTGEDVVQPEKALVLGPGRVMGREFSDITCRVIDLAAREIAVGEDALGETLLAEIRSRPDHPEVAYRAGRRYVQMLGRVPLEAVRSDQPARLRAGGTYLITGGLGGIGLEIAKYLAQAVKANLVLTARTPLPERDAWIDHLAAHGEDDTISRRIRAVIAVEEAGGQVMVAAADTADRTAMQEVVAEATRRFGPINGVVHSAGVPGGGVILLKQREEAARVLRPKVDGSRVLYDIFGGSELDFMVLCSSATSILGNAGQVDYCAANAYQDCFARRFAADTGTFTVAVNWGRWREVGMAVEAAQVSGHRGPLTGASNAEGIEAFRRVLDAGVQPQVAVFEEDMVAALDRTAADEPTDRDGEEAGRDDRADASTATGYARPRLASEYAPPETDLERAIAAIWEQILGIEGIGRHDDFFELGGHSLIATRIVSRLREMIDVDVSLRAALEHKTIATLAASLDAPASSTTLPPIVPIARDSKDKIPLSYAQRSLWFLDQLGASTGYNLGLSLRYDGRLDIDRLRETFAAMTDRHEVLRTSFPDDGGHAYQRIVDAVEIPIRVVDVAHLTSEAGVAEAHRTAGVEFMQPFDLAEGPLLRAAVVRMRDGDVLIITVHHIVSDAWSVPLFRREIVDRYDLLSRGIEPDFPPLPVQYADFAAWQNTWFDEAALRSQMDYWTAQLGGELPVLELPTDRPRPPLQTFNGASRRITFTPELFDDIRGFARDRGVTTAMVMLAAFKVLLSRYTGLEDVVVGSPIAGRTRTEIEDLIGFFVNTLVMRTDLSGEPSFDTVVERVKRVALEAYEHQDLPFERLVDQLDPERDLRRHPLFQVAFVMLNTVDTAAATDTGFTNLSTDVTVTRTDIELYLFEHPAAMGGTLVYNTDLFDGATIERMLEHYLRLLESALDDPAAPITTLPMLSDAERTEVLDTWNATDAPFAADRSIHELFEDRVDEAPDALALVFEDTQLTYGQLEARANRIAHVLREMGVGRDVMVGLCVDRGLDMIAGLLGILKAGGAYVPIDAAYPRDRIAFMLEDSQAPVLVTQSHLLETFPETGARVLCLDIDAERIDVAPETRPELITTADDVAYVIYTSGSTGRPKGVLVEHCGLCHLVAVQIEAFGIRADSRVLQFASFSFDASVSEIFTALVSGATLVLAEPDVLLPGPELIDLMRAQRVTTATLTPSVLGNLPDADLPDLETIVSAGEACSADLVRRWASTARFINAYGPTEITVCATLGTCDPASERAPSIGRPIANARVYVLDRAMRPTPVGAVGELYVGGPGVARGYLNAPALTAERFVPDPFGGGSARLYRTGDLARFRADGTIDYVGRADHQVKVRGYRIEPGEVEAALREHRDVRDVVVVKRDVARPIDRGEPEERARTIELWPSVAEFFVYDEVLYHAMTHDERRNDAYRAAINAIVPDRVVLDIGTGADAILSRLCVEGGARKVYAIELLDESYRAAKATIERLGLQDRIHLIQGNAMEVELPERVDVCVSEIVGAIGGSEGAAAIINDAWRFMKDGGVMIPDRSRTMIAAIVLPDDFVERPAFNKAGAGYVERVFEQVGYRFDLRLCLKNLVRDDIVSSVGCFEDLDYMRSIELETEHAIELRVHRDGRVNGFLVWLTLQTMPGYEIDILDHEYCWLPVFLPVFHPPIEVSRGDVIRARITRTLCENGLNPDYRLAGAVQRSAGPDVPFEYTAHHFRRVYRQTPFYEELFRDDAVPSRAPAPTPAGRGAPDTTYESQLVAYVVDDVHWSPGNDEPDVGQSDLVEHWRSLYEDTYGETSRSAPDPTFNIAGWNSSFDGEPIPADEMREWVEQTVERIREQQPRHVLELGCGSGLLLYRIAPHCERYVGTDFSHAAVDSIARYIGSNGAFANVALRQGAADEIVAGTDERFDTIVLNSVVRYFPDAEYLATVLAGAAGRLEPGGRIFVGDVRNLALLRAFHTAVQLHGVPDDLDLHRLRQRVDHHLNQDQELVVDPAFFLAMRERIPSVTSVEIRPKRGAYDNELSRYRYDVVLHVGGAAPPAPDGNAVDWRRDDLTLVALRDRLRDAAPETLVLTGVPNARNERDVIAVERTGDAEIADVAALRRAIDDEFTASPGVDPEALRALAHDLGYAIAIDLTAGRSDGSFDVMLHRAGSGPMPAITPTARHTADLSTLTNDPLRGRRLRHLVPALREHARNRLPEYMVPAVFVLLDALPVTPNGKIDLRALPAPETLRSDLASAYAEPGTPAESALTNAWAQVLGLERVGIHDNFFELGGDSIQSVQVVAAAREAGVRITALDLFQHQTVAALAAVATPIEGAATHEDELVVGDVPLGPIQRWFVEQELAAPHHFNQTVLLQARDPVDPDALREVLDAIIGHHDALRLRLVRTDDGTWRQHVVETEAVALEYIDLGPVPAGERTALITKRSSEIQSQLDLADGPIIRAALFQADDEPRDRLLLAIHHIAVDGVSWRVLIEDLQRGLEQRRAGKAVALPPRTTSIRTWVERLREHADSAEFAAQAAHWLDQPWASVDPIPCDHAATADAGTIGTAENIVVALSPSQTSALLRDVPAAYGTRINDVLLAALVRAMALWTGCDTVLVDLEGHGRRPLFDEIDLSRTVGWFTAIHPLLLRVPGARDEDWDPGASLKIVKECLRTVPSDGIPFGIASYLAADPAITEPFRAIPSAPIAFNYLGQFDRTWGRDAAFAMSSISPGPSLAAQNRREHRLEINGAVHDGALRTTWTYSPAHHDRSTIEAVAENYTTALDAIITHCAAPDAGGFTPSDFEELDVGHDELQDIVAEIEQGEA